MLCATLHAVATPLRDGLTQALGGRKAFCSSAFQCSFPRLRLALRFGQVVGTLLLRSNLSGALTHRVRYVRRLRKRCLVSVSAPLLMLSFLTGPAESSWVRARAFPLRFSASASGSDLHRRPPPPNNSFKPTPCRGIGHVLYATLAHVRRPATGRLNSGVRRQKNIRFQPHFACSTAPLIFAPLPSLAAALVVFSNHAVLRIVRLARSNFACVSHSGFGIDKPHRLVSSRRTRSFGDGRRKVFGARSGLLASAFGEHAWPSSALASPAA